MLMVARSSAKIDWYVMIPDDHVVSRADAAHAPTGQMSDLSWPVITPRVAKRVRHSLPPPTN